MAVVREGRGGCVHRVSSHSVYRVSAGCSVGVGRPAVAAVLIGRANLIGEGKVSVDVDVGDRHELRVH